MTTTTTSASSIGSVNMGLAVPPFTPHAISVSLPTWRDNVDYEAGDKRVLDSMVSGYPRFFIHLRIRKLARICEQKFGASGELCLLFPSKKAADHCRAFMLDRATQEGVATNPYVRLVQYLICPEDTAGESPGIHQKARPHSSASTQSVELHIVLFPSDLFPVAKQFWQHTGMGISSRLADHCLSLLPDEHSPSHTPLPSSPISPKPTFRTPNKHYSVKHSPKTPSLGESRTPAFILQAQLNPSEPLSKDQDTYLEERYGRNLPLSAGTYAKRALRRRIAGVLVRDNADDGPGGPSAGAQDAQTGPSSRGVQDVTEDDVYLYPTGMTAIWNAHQLVLGARPPAKSVCFGFPYTDTLKILQKWGPGCHFLGHGLDSDIDTLETILATETASSASSTSTPPVLALFTEFPSNPLLRSANLPRLRALADKYDFLLVVDETIGNFVNVEVLPYADIVVSSLTKIFSGDANAMGGRCVIFRSSRIFIRTTFDDTSGPNKHAYSLVLNPKGRHYTTLKAHMRTAYEDIFFSEDALFVERNSRDFAQRIKIIDANTHAVCSFLYSRSVSSPNPPPSPAVKQVFYPTYITPEHYNACRLPEGGFGGLFSLTFTSLAASEAFFDALPCYKGPSLGTNFTLACPYTILAHFTELPWAAEYGVEEGLVRISVGMEGKELLLRDFEIALRAAEAVVCN
ncbi:pyridoxal phosphate-dependent transferase [Hygrophoropsis aurantiaca]|uniref:Pyridoxal phosphate-dependent transferase n=1 Tax=Hygrophoropsis aurantiaca TaxID=72124 RepID=A0ACB8A975_9AGAM|nr:pyridoxal phosphate-dependent transferase [Hygrophoropsis aurantiaca]